MPYIGHNPTNAGSFIFLDDIASSFNGSATQFNLAVGGVAITPNTQNLLIALDGVIQQAPDAYTVSGSSITFTAAVPASTDFYGILMGQSASIGQGTIGADELKISGNGTSGQLVKSDGDGSYSYLSTTDITAVGTLSSLTLGGDLTLPQKIVHSGDTDTYLSFGDNSLSLYTDGTNVLDFIYGNIYLKGNNKALIGYTTGASAKELIKLDSSDVVRIGEGLPVQIGYSNATPKLEWFYDHSNGTDYKANISLAGNDLEIRGSSGVMEFYTGAVDGASSTLAFSINSSQNATFASQVNFGTTASYIKQSNFGYSSSYKVLQLGLATSTSAISIGADLTGNASGGFTGNEIIIPNARGILAPNGADNAYLGVLGVTSNNTIEIGRGNHSIVTEGNGAISIDTSNDNLTFKGTARVEGKRLDLASGTTGNDDFYIYSIADDIGGTQRIGSAIKFISTAASNANDGKIAFMTAEGNTNTERMRVASDGAVLFHAPNGVTTKTGQDAGSGILAGGASFQPNSVGRSILYLGTYNYTSSASVARFTNQNGIIGSIDVSGSATAFSTSSDYRLKENEVLISDGLTRLNQLKPYRFNFKADADTTVDGFFAHEVSDIVPEAVFGEKDAVNDDGSIKSQRIDQSKLVPLLVKAVQELSAKVEAIENA